MRISPTLVATAAAILATTAIAAASSVTGSYTTDPTSGDILSQMGFQSGINLSTIAGTVAGPAAFITFMGSALNAANRIQQAQGHWHELIHSGASTGFIGLMLGGGGLYWSKTHQATGALLPHAHHIARIFS
jgi:hypothetical protein